MQTITTKNNGNIYQMDLEEAQEVVEIYAEQNCGGDTRQARSEMTRWVDDLPVRQRVAIRRILAEQSAVCG